MFFGTSEYSESKKIIEYISYSPEYREQVLEVFRKSFFLYESACICVEVRHNPAALDELLNVVVEVIEKGNVSIIARDVDKNLVVGVALNVIQVNTPDDDGPNYFEYIRDNSCKTDNAKGLMNYMIEADRKVNFFELFQVNCLMELMFLTVLPEYGQQQIGLNLMRFSVGLAADLKNGKNVSEFLKAGEPTPQIVAVLWTTKNSQSIGRKLGFEVILAETFENFTFRGKSFAEKVGDLQYHAAVKKI